jgi:GTPase SAR1 family protein
MEYLQKFSQIPIVIVGTRCEKENQRQVDRNTAFTFAESQGCGFFEVSAKQNTNITESFTDLVRRIDAWKETHTEFSSRKKSSRVVSSETLLV